MEYVFQHVNCVMATHSVVTTAMNPTALAITVRCVDCYLWLSYTMQHASVSVYTVYTVV